MKPFQEVSYGSIEQTSGSDGPPVAAALDNSSKKCSQKESANNLIAVISVLVAVVKCLWIEHHAGHAAMVTVAVITGAGMLSLPYTAAAMGWSAIGLMAILLVTFLYSYVLLANSIDTVTILRQHRREEGSVVHSHSHNHHYHSNTHQGSETISLNSSLIDYTVLGKEAFGHYGDKLVLGILGTELFLALVSFFINIGININVIFSGVSIEVAILISSGVASFMSFLDMKTISKFTAGGNIATTLTVVALILSGYFLHRAMLVGDIAMPEAEEGELGYVGFNMRGVPVSLGVMAYCFGGHGAFPKIYNEMADKKHYTVAISIVASFVLCLYAVIIAVGYYYYGEHTKIPVTVNIGSDLEGHPLPSSESLKVIAALGLICNIQATCPIMVITISEMVTTVMWSDEATSGGGARVVSRKLILVIALMALLIALFLREYFLQVCGIVGAFATITSSIFLPITFFHTLYGRMHPVSTGRTILHLCIALLASVSMFVGVTSSVCAILESDSAICSLTVPDTA